jgi:hypothetical protein
MGPVRGVPLDLPESQLAIVGDELHTVLLGLAADLAYLDGKEDPDGFVSEVAAYARLATYTQTGTALLPDRAGRKALRRLSGELDDRNEYDRVVAEHDAFKAFESRIRTTSPRVERGRR